MLAKSIRLPAWVALLVLLCTFPLVSSAAQTRNLQKLDLATIDNKVQINLTFSQTISPPEIRSFSTKTHPSIVLDFLETENGLPSRDRYGRIHKVANLGVLRDITIVQQGKRIRAVLNLKQAASYHVNVKGNTVTVRLTMTHISNAKAYTTKFSTLPTGAKTRHHEINDIDFRRNRSGAGSIVVTVSDPNIGIDVEHQSQRLIVHFLDTQISSKLLRQLNVVDFGTPVQTITTRLQGQEIEMIITVKGPFQHLAYQINKRFIINIKPRTKQKKLSEKAKRKKPVYTGKPLTLNFQRVSVRSVLQLLAEFTGLNIVVSDSVQGDITLRLRDVPWDQALDIIMKTQGLGKRLFGNVILIAPNAELAARERQDLQSEKQIEDLEPLQSELIRLKFAKALDVAGLLKDKEASLLSARGNVSVDDRTNTLWIQDIPIKLTEIRDLIEKLDIPVKQVLIEARIVNVDSSYEKNLGVKFGISRAKTLSGTLTGANEFAKETAPAEITIADRLNFDLPAGALASGTRAASIGIALASLGGGYLLDLELSAIESEGGGEVVSSPRLITANQQAAHIEVGTEIPFQVATSSGATAVEFKKAVLSLEVVPHITPNHKIILNLKVNQDKQGENTNAGPAIDTREVETQVLVNNGQTIVLGGIYERDKKSTVERVPFLGSLPIIGGFFRHKTQTDKRTELLIFVTPRIVKQSLT